jgi:hypothetical protein
MKHALPGHVCRYCRHLWVPRKSGIPVACPKCKRRRPVGALTSPSASLFENALERHEVELREMFGDVLVDRAFQHELAARLASRRGAGQEAVLKELRKVPAEVAAYLHRVLVSEELVLTAG